MSLNPVKLARNLFRKAWWVEEVPRDVPDVIGVALLTLLGYGCVVGAAYLQAASRGEASDPVMFQTGAAYFFTMVAVCLTSGSSLLRRTSRRAQALSLMPILAVGLVAVFDMVCHRLEWWGYLIAGAMLFFTFFVEIASGRPSPEEVS